MSHFHIPFDTRTVKYEEYPFKINNSPIAVSVSENEMNGPQQPHHEPYEYFDRKLRHSSTGMGNVRHMRKKHLPKKAEAVQALNVVVMEEKPKENEPAKGIGLLTKPPGAAAAAAAEGPIIPNEISKSFHSKKQKPSATPKRKPPPPTSIKNNKINSIVGRSAFKPSIIITADKPTTTQALNKKRTKKDIFGSY
jgi:hypothetical protein